MSEPRVGIVGLRRGLTLGRRCEEAGLRVTGVCDSDRSLASAAAAELRAESFADFPDLLAGPVDAVILANFFDEHQPLALEALAAGKHVLSETAACVSLVEGQALIDAAERAAAVYMFGENYPFKPHTFEIARRFAAGEIGALQYAECEYYHAFTREELSKWVTDRSHWRARIASTQYCTHSIAPVMALGGAFPISVSTFEVDSPAPGTGMAVVEMIRLDDGSLLKSLHGFLQGEPPQEWSWLRVHGERGLLESLRHGDGKRVRVAGHGEPDEIAHPPDVPDDLRMLRAFRDAVTGGAPPRQDARFGVACSLVGIYALESLRRSSAPVELPNFRARA